MGGVDGPVAGSTPSVTDGPNTDGHLFGLVSYGAGDRIPGLEL